MAIDAKIRNIIKNNGHIKIDDMMRQVLSLNKSSYYKSTRNIGENGDFITSPEISQLFGEIIALWAIEKWQQLGEPNEFALVELGPGQGKLMQDFLRVAKMVPDFLRAANIYLMDINPNFIIKQKDNLADYQKDIKWIKRIEQIPSLPMILIANEFFDALPIKQYMKVKDKWFESIFVADPVDGRIKYDKSQLHTALQTQLFLDYKTAQDGAVLEESLESLEIMRFCGKHISKHSGAGLIIDYGYDIEPMKRKRNQYTSTLQAIKNHQYHSVISSLGEADLTAHVDFNALKKAGAEQGVNQHNSKICTQQEFLVNYGIEIRLASLQQKVSKEEADILNRQVFRLTAPQQMGELFKVLEIYVDLQ